MPRKGQGLFVCLDADFVSSDHAQWLRRTLGCYGVLDYVIPLWIWAIKRDIKDGIVSLTAKKLASIINWVGPVEQAWEAFTEPELGLLEGLGDGRYRIRGWDAWAARIFRDRDRKAEWKRRQPEKECSGRRLPERYPRDQILDQDHDQVSKRSEKGCHTGGSIRSDEVCVPDFAIKNKDNVYPSSASYSWPAAKTLSRIDPLGDPPDTVQSGYPASGQISPPGAFNAEVHTETSAQPVAPARSQASQSDPSPEMAPKPSATLEDFQSSEELKKELKSALGYQPSACDAREHEVPTSIAVEHPGFARARSFLASRGIVRGWSAAEVQELDALDPAEVALVNAYSSASRSPGGFSFGLFLARLRPRERPVEQDDRTTPDTETIGTKKPSRRGEKPAPSDSKMIVPSTAERAKAELAKIMEALG